MTRRNVRKQGWVFPLFSPNSDDQLSLNFHRFVILYISCDTRSVDLGQYCLPKVSNGFKARHTGPDDKNENENNKNARPRLVE